uniref:Acyl-CoA_ox_N domain-containing protein n=1 Tax=Caenorhabditis japonica TaxID=281687 RepID=A0A8R1EAN3_CAEJA
MTSLNKSIRSGDNPDITEERQKSTFDTHAMAAVIYGSSKIAQRRREISAATAQIPELADVKPLPFMTRDEKVEESIRKIAVLTKHQPHLINPSDSHEYLHLHKRDVSQPTSCIHALSFL